MEIRVFELPFAQQLKTLHDDLLDIGRVTSGKIQVEKKGGAKPAAKVNQGVSAN